MNQLISRFSRNLLLLSLLLGALATLLYFVIPSLITPAIPWIIPFYLLTTFLQFFVLVKNSEGKFSRFTNYYMAASVIKLLILLSVIVVYAFLFRQDVLRFSVTILLLYIVFTVFEVIWLLKLNRNIKDSKAKQGNE